MGVLPSAAYCPTSETTALPAVKNADLDVNIAQFLNLC
jgi:hypothetical protein